MHQLWNHQWAITAGVPTIREGLQKRTLPVLDRGTLEGVQVPVQARRQMVHPCSYSENISEKEVLTSREGCVSLDKTCDPRLLRRPRHKRKEERTILLMP